MIKVRAKVSDEACSLAVVVCAGSLREAERIVKKRYPESAVGIAFPIEPNHYFVEGPPRPVRRSCGDGRAGCTEGGHRSTGITSITHNISFVVCLS
jgi:hypothetical protein